jgi:hypothetical protein
MSRRFANVSMRLPSAVLAALNEERVATGSASLTAVVQRRLELELATLPAQPARALWRRQERRADRSFFSLKPEVVEQLRFVSLQGAGSIGDVALNLLVNSLRDVPELAA